VINSADKDVPNIQIPLYFKKNGELLRKNGLDERYGVTNFEGLRILILDILSKFDSIIINTAGFDYVNIDLTKVFLCQQAKISKKTFFLIQHKEIAFELSSFTQERLIYINKLDS
jgi:hypothetical protein